MVEDNLREDTPMAEIAGIDTCLGCNKAIIHTKGKKKRKWCSDACRKATSRRSNPDTKSGQIKSGQPNKLNLMADVINEQANIPADKRKQVRGKDIKCFTDLPLDVQATINRISESNEEKQKRTKIAIAYQHTFR